MIDASTLDLQEKVVAINRVSKTVKGGRVMKFSALVVVGDGNGIVGFGLGKAAEVPEAIRKGMRGRQEESASSINMKGTTIPHETVGAFGAGRVLLQVRRSEGTGVIAGGAVRAVAGGCRYQGYPHEVPAHQQPLQRGYRHGERPVQPAERRAGGSEARQDRERNSGLRRQ